MIQKEFRYKLTNQSMSVIKVYLSHQMRETYIQVKTFFRNIEFYRN